MVTPSTPKPVAITITDGVKGQPITIINQTTGEILNETMSATAKHITDLQNLCSGWTTGDSIEISDSGEMVGSTTLTTTSSTTKPQTVTVSTVAIGTTHSRGI